MALHRFLNNGFINLTLLRLEASPSSMNDKNIQCIVNSRYPAFVETHHCILNRIFLNICLILGLTMLWVGLSALRTPLLFAQNFGLPLQPVSPRTEPSSSNPQPEIDNKAGTGWIVVFAGRELSLATALLALLYLDETRALSVIVLAMSCVAVGDSVATLKYGRSESVGQYVGQHAIPGAFMVGAGILGGLLHLQKRVVCT